MTKSNIWYNKYEDIVEDLHELATDDAFNGYGCSRAKLLLHIINEIELEGHDEKTFKDNDASEIFVNVTEEILEEKIETLEERIKKLEAKL